MRIVSIIALLVGVPFAFLACNRETNAVGATPTTGPAASAEGKSNMVYVRVINPEGKLSDPVVIPKVVKSDEEWQKILTPEQYRITRGKGTEAAFCGGLLKNKEAGIYFCLDCGLPLFRSDAKFESGTGWPSFFQPVAPENVRERPDFSHGMARTETLCARCDAHLGHLFDDGPRPTGLRFCMNSESLKFKKNEDLKSAGEQIPPQPQIAEAVIAGGCFWCVEAVFEEIDGVHDVISGYAGGDKATANYETVSTGTTKHAEAVKIVYDPRKVPFEELLKVHFATHDPTTKDRQGNDVGPQYRSAIFYRNEQEKQIAEATISDMNASGKFKAPIVTTLEPLTEFYPAESYHQNYVCRNPYKGYVRAIALPKVAKVREKFQDKVKSDSTGAAIAE